MSDTASKKNGKAMNIVEFYPHILNVYSALAKVTMHAHELRDAILSAEKARGCKGGEEIEGLLGFMLAVNQTANVLGETITDVYYGSKAGLPPTVR